MNSEIHEQIKRRSEATLAIFNALWGLSVEEGVKAVMFALKLVSAGKTLGLSREEAEKDLRLAVEECHQKQLANDIEKIYGKPL